MQNSLDFRDRTRKDGIRYPAVNPVIKQLYKDSLNEKYAEHVDWINQHGYIVIEQIPNSENFTHSLEIKEDCKKEAQEMGLHDIQ